MRLRPRHLRSRLTLWYVAMLASLLVLAWGGTCGLLFWQLRTQLDQFSIQEIETVEGLFYFDGQLHMREDYHNHPESKDVIERYLEVLTMDGTVLFRNGSAAVRWAARRFRERGSAAIRSAPRSFPTERRCGW